MREMIIEIFASSRKNLYGIIWVNINLVRKCAYFFSCLVAHKIADICKIRAFPD